MLLQLPYFLAGSSEIRLPAVAPIMTDVACITVHVAAVTIDVPIFLIQLGALVRSRPIISFAQVTIQLPLVVSDLGFVLLDITLISSAIGVVMSQVSSIAPSTVLRQHGSRAHGCN